MLKTIMLQFLKPGQLWQRVTSKKISNYSSSHFRHLFRPTTVSHPYPQLIRLQQLSQSYEASPTSSSSLLPFISMMVASAIGLGSLPTALADGPVTEDGLPQLHSSSEPGTSSDCSVENLIIKERRRLEELLTSKGMQKGSYPKFTVAGRVQKVTIKFKIPPTCEVTHLIVDLVSHLGLKAENNGGGSEMLLRAWDSAAAWQVTLNYPEKDIVESGLPEDVFSVLIFESLVGSEFCEIEFIKKGSFNDKELDALAHALKLAGGKDVKKSLGKNPRTNTLRREKSPSFEKSVSALEAMGVRVYGFDETSGLPLGGSISWENIAGYEEQKREIEDTVLRAL